MRAIRARPKIVAMGDNNGSDNTGIETVDREAADPYGDVALGVECAWPQSIPLSEAASLEAQS
jgi:hypothetical protein